MDTMDTKNNEMKPPKRNTTTPDLHHAHIRVPIAQWKRFRRNFPEQGDLARVFLLALDKYLDEWERTHGR